ncbi:unnamed protein product, partial [Porites lobata]
LLPHYAGPEVDEIFDTLPNTGDNSDYATAVEKLNEYFSTQTNIAYEVFKFRQTKQKDSESLNSYNAGLRQLAKTCEFSNINKEIKEPLILTCSSNSLGRRSLRENLTLDAILKLGRALELSEEQARQEEKAVADVNATETKGSERPDGKVASLGTDYSSEDEYEFAYTINYIESKKPPMCQVQVNGKTVEMMIGTGASVNPLDEATFH